VKNPRTHVKREINPKKYISENKHREICSLSSSREKTPREMLQIQ
jgi:hypothetical protein